MDHQCRLRHALVHRWSSHHNNPPDSSTSYRCHRKRWCPKMSHYIRNTLSLFFEYHRFLVIPNREEGRQTLSIQQSQSRRTWTNWSPALQWCEMMRTIMKMGLRTISVYDTLDFSIAWSCVFTCQSPCRASKSFQKNGLTLIRTHLPAQRPNLTSCSVMPLLLCTVPSPPTVRTRPRQCFAFSATVSLLSRPSSLNS